MPESISIIEDLYRYNDWANGRVFALCHGLTNQQLDTPRELGFGSLRNTLFHILTAEQIWLERWQVVPWRPFPTDSQGMGLSDIESQLKQIAQARQQMINSERATQWQRVVNYMDSRRHEYSNSLDVLLLHVANHSTYHRAQALNFLKGFGKTVPVGLDYLMYKVARPSLEQPTESVAAFRKIGLEVATAPGWRVRWDRQLIERYFTYHDWGNDQVLAAVEDADDSELDRPFDIGPGSLRRTLMHVLDAEQFWLSYWNGESEKPPKNSGLSVQQLCQGFTKVREARNQIVATVNQESSQRVITATPGGIPLKVHLVESFIQICTHGAHHRAQLVNMLRHSKRKVPSADLIDWWRATA